VGDTLVSWRLRSKKASCSGERPETLAAAAAAPSITWPSLTEADRLRIRKFSCSGEYFEASSLLRVPLTV
jgi:hypothetical protein